MRLSDAWGRVCNNSASLGHYWNSDWHKEEFELTGSRDVCGFCDLANTYKLLAVDPVRRGYFVASGYYNNLSNIYPIANKVLLCSRDTVFGYGVGWVILER